MRTIVIVPLVPLLLVACPDSQHPPPEADAPDASASRDASDASQSQDLMEAYAAKLRECAVLSAGSFDVTVRDAFDTCEMECALDAPCEEIQRLICAEDQSETDYLWCIADCFDSTYEDQFICNLEESETVPHAFVCDGIEDCTAGEDESDCDYSETTCDDGTPVLDIYLCDHWVDCPDGSDEPEGCAQLCDAQP